MQNCLDYIASLKRLPDEHYCSGVVITSFHVLTAAYCLYPYKNQYLFGRIFVIIGYIEHSISGMQYHSEYRFSKDDNDRVNSTNFDIGLITVSEISRMTLKIGPVPNFWLHLFSIMHQI